MSIKLKRIYDNPEKEDGYRILIDRLWPRGVAKDEAMLDLWLKEIAPSDDLRHWFNHDPAKWPEFQHRYLAELDQNPALKQLQELVKQHPSTTLLYAAHDTEHNNAIVLKRTLDEK